VQKGQAVQRLTNERITGHIVRQILVVGGHQVMIDADLAALYGVTTKRFNEP
jgi:hypothetical protein